MSTVYPHFSIGFIYAEEDVETSSMIQNCCYQLRSQGFRIHDFGIFGCLDNYLEWIEDSDVIVVFCTPDMKRYGDQLFITERPSVPEKLKSKISIPVLLYGDEKSSIPDWAEGTVLDVRKGQQSEFDMHHMEVPLGNALRRIEFKMLDAMVTEEERRNVCLDCVSVKRRKKQQRFILYNMRGECFVRVLLALGRSLVIINPFPEWLIYEDPVFFAPNKHGEVTLQMAHVGDRDLNPSSKNYGAYYLDKPIKFKVPERLLYYDHSELVRIATNLLQTPDNSDCSYQEAALDDLYLMDMELDVPIPDEETIKRINDIWTDQEAMERAINLWGTL